jgi:hypothetical protein
VALAWILGPLVVASFGTPARAEGGSGRPVPKTQYRGFTAQWIDRPILEEAVKKWNANQVRYMMCPAWRQHSMKMPSIRATWEKMLADLPANLDIAKELGVAIVLDLHHLPDDHPKTYPQDPKKGWWYDEDNLNLMIECWKQLATICKDRDQVIWFDLYNEPVEDAVVHSHPSYPTTWPRWAQRVIDEIRKIDTRHPVVVEPGPGMFSWGFDGFPLLKDPYQEVIYSPHVYMPLRYTHQGVSDVVIGSWPGVYVDHGGGVWNKKRLLREYADVVAYQKKHGVRIWVGEFSVSRWSPGAARYLRECIEMFEAHGWDWCYHALQESQIWDLSTVNDVDLYDAKGNYVRTGIAKENSGLFYPKQEWPYVKVPVVSEALTDRGEVVYSFMKRNAPVPTSANGKSTSTQPVR